MEEVLIWIRCLKHFNDLCSLMRKDCQEAEVVVKGLNVERKYAINDSKKLNFYQQKTCWILDIYKKCIINGIKNQHIVLLNCLYIISCLGCWVSRKNFRDRSSKNILAHFMKIWLKHKWWNLLICEHVHAGSKKEVKN